MLLSMLSIRFLFSGKLVANLVLSNRTVMEPERVIRVLSVALVQFRIAVTSQLETITGHRSDQTVATETRREDG